MKNPKIIILITVLIFFSFLIQAQEKWTGNWSGKINLPTGELEMIFIISESDSGMLAKLDVPVQGAKGLTVRSYNKIRQFDFKNSDDNGDL